MGKSRHVVIRDVSGVFRGGGLVGVQTPPHDRTDENFQLRIKKMVYSVLCVIYAVSLAQ